MGCGTLACSCNPEGVSITFGYQSVSSQDKLMVNNFFFKWVEIYCSIDFYSFFESGLSHWEPSHGFFGVEPLSKPVCYCAESQHLHKPKQTVFLKPLESLDL